MNQKEKDFILKYTLENQNQSKKVTSRFFKDYFIKIFGIGFSFFRQLKRHGCLCYFQEYVSLCTLPK